ncbi:MAG: hypothetical protein JWR35_317 [Marmoricola sp.]|nr:hypothetical protein [Marmoricola sp.]
MSAGLARTRAVADAVLYEGYLLYPYRASSSKNRSRWQFGVLGPAGATEAGFGEPASMRLQTVTTAPAPDASITVHVRFLQLQSRQVHDAAGTAVAELPIADPAAPRTELTWDEAVECEVEIRLPGAALTAGVSEPIVVAAGEDSEPILGAAGVEAGRVARRRWPLAAELTASLVVHGRYAVLDIEVRNTHGAVPLDRDDAIRHSLIGTHLIAEADGLEFVSLTDPPDDAADLVARQHQDRCWPMLAGAPGDTDLLLGSPIILSDYPEIAGESAGSLFDATEIDEILTLRVMTMTDAEKAEARATDPRAAEIIDRCDGLSPEELQLMHGINRNPHDLAPTSFDTGDVPWWSPEEDASVRPGLDSVLIDGVSVARDSLVRVHPGRRADAQDLFFADQVARVTAVLSDVDGGTHVALVLVDDPAADLHDLAGRYWYFAPDELEPLSPEAARSETTETTLREENSQ